MVSFGDRIRALANAIGKDEQDIAKDLGITKSRMSHYITGRSRVPSDMLQKIVDLYNINPTYLFKDNAPLYDVIKEERPEYGPAKEYTYFPTAISAGLPMEVGGITESSKISIADELIGKYSNDQSLFFARASGDSMNEVFEDDSLIGIKPLPLEQLKNGDIVVYSDSYDYSVKEYYKYGDTLVFKPSSTNPVHEEHTYNVNDNIMIHGKVVVSVNTYD